MRLLLFLMLAADALFFDRKKLSRVGFLSMWLGAGTAAAKARW